MPLVANLIAQLLVGGALAWLSAIAGGFIARRHPAKGRWIDGEGGRLHIDELGDHPKYDPAVVLVHGASGNMEDMRIALGGAFRNRYRTILLDRPGRGWSERQAGAEWASPQRQADMLAEALGKLGVRRAVIVGHSWGGAFATAFAIRHPALTAGLVLLAPTSHPWGGGVSWYYHLTGVPVLGPLFARTLVLPLGMFLARGATASVFSPQTPPEGYLHRSATLLVLRPTAFAANARDMTELKANLRELVPHYPSIAAPTVIIVGDRDLALSNDIHAFALAKAIPGAQLRILEDVGHVPHHARPDLVVEAIDDVLRQGTSSPETSADDGPTPGSIATTRRSGR